MQVEHVARIRLAARRTAKDERHLTVSDGLLAQVVEYHKGMTACIAEILADSCSCKRSVILESGGIGGRGSHHYSIVHRSLLPEGLYDRGHGGALLAHGHVDTVHRVAVKPALTLVDDRVDGNGSLSGLAVADDQLTLTPSDGNHGVYGLKTGLERLVHRLAEYYPGSLTLQRHAHSLALHLAKSVQRRTDGVHDTAYQALAYIDTRDAPQTPHPHVFLYLVGGTEKHGSDAVFLEVHHHGFHTAVKLKEFARFGLRQAVDTGHAVADGEHVAHFFVFKRSVDTLQLPVQYLRNLACFNSVLCHPYTIRLFFSTN